MLSRNLGYKTTGDATWLNVFLTPQQRCATGEPGNVQGQDRVGIVEGSCGYRDHGVSIRDKFVLSRNLGYEGSRHVAKPSSDPPQQRYVTGEPRKLQGRDGMGIVERSCGYRARGVSSRGKFVLSRNLGYEEDRHVSKRSSDPPAAVCHGRARQRSGTGPCPDCSRFLWVAGPRGQYSEKIRFIEKPGVHDG